MSKDTSPRHRSAEVTRQSAAISPKKVEHCLQVTFPYEQTQAPTEPCRGPSPRGDDWMGVHGTWNPCGWAGSPPSGPTLAT